MNIFRKLYTFRTSLMGLVASLVGIALIPRWLPQYSSELVYTAQWLMLTAPLTLLQLMVAAALEASGEFAAFNQLRCLLPLTTLIPDHLLTFIGFSC